MHDDAAVRRLTRGIAADATDAAAKTLAALNLATASDDATTLRWLGVGNVFGVVRFAHIPTAAAR